MKTTTAVAAKRTDFDHAKEALRVAEQDLVHERDRLRERGAQLGPIKKELAAARNALDQAADVESMGACRARVTQLTATEAALVQELEDREHIIKKRQAEVDRARQAIEGVVNHAQELRRRLEVERQRIGEVRSAIEKASADLASWHQFVVAAERRIQSLELELATVGA